MEPDSKLIKLISEDNRKAQIDLYKMCFNVLMGIAVRYKNNKDEAAELVNDAFLKIIKNLKNRKENVSFEAWIRRIILNLIIDEYRKNKKEKLLFVRDKVGHSYENISFNAVEEIIEDERLQSMLMSLPNATRNVFNLFAIDGYTHKEIAKMLGISLETSKWHMKEARKKLKKQLTLEKVA